MALSKTLTKLAISNYVATQCGLKKTQATKIVNSVLTEISVSLKNLIDVKINKFGNLQVKHKKARYGRNPKTLKAAVISERKVVLFKANKKLNKIINKNTGICD